MRQNECYIMIGPIGAGKTTYAKELAREAALIYLCPDDHWDRTRSGRYSDETSIQTWGRIYDQIYQCIKRRRNFVLDSAQVRRSSRREITGVIRTVSRGTYRVKAVHMQCDLQRCLQGVRSRRDLVPEEKVREYFEVLQRELPDLDDGYDEIITVQR
jgi:predicted kinase